MNQVRVKLRAAHLEFAPADRHFRPHYYLISSRQHPLHQKITSAKVMDVKYCSFSRLAFDADCPVVVIYYSPYNRKSKPGPVCLWWCKTAQTIWADLFGIPCPVSQFSLLCNPFARSSIACHPLPSTFWIRAAFQHSMRGLQNGKLMTRISALLPHRLMNCCIGDMKPAKLFRA